MSQRKLRFGANYVPSKHWWYSWVDWDATSIAADLEAIASLGLDHIRVHCLWPVFQPNASFVSEVALDHLDELLDISDRYGLDVQVAVLDGWLSGFVFSPAWQRGKNLFTDAAMVEAEKHLFCRLGERIGGHPRFLGFDLGNELGCLQALISPVATPEADAWQEAMLAYCSEIAPGKLHVNGVDHVHWFRNFGFSRHGLATAGALTSLHTWIKFTGAMSLYTPNEVGCLHLAEYCIELAKAYHEDLDRLVWVQEFGASAQWMPEGDIPSFAAATIRNAATCANLWGFTWWCSHDLNPGLAGFAPLEYDLGLLDHQNRVKPVGTKIAQIASELACDPPTPAERSVALVLPEDVFAREGHHPGWHFGKHYMALIEQGIRPSVVLASRAGDSAYLAARGISELREIE